MNRMCAALNVSRSGYYAWLKRPKSQRMSANEELLGRIREIHQKRHRTYGSPRVYAELRNQGFSYGIHRIERLMRQNNIVAQRHTRYKRPASTAHGRIDARNLLNRRFSVPAPNQAWVADITCFWTGSGWLYLAIVIDLYSRRVIGWAMRHRITEELSIDALEMALMSRKPRGPLLHHSDRGSQYSSKSFCRRLNQNGIQASMSRKGDCYDNAVAESFFKTLKAEWARRHRYKTREEARASIFEFIEVFYNRQRLHSTLGYLSPVDFENRYVS